MPYYLMLFYLIIIALLDFYSNNKTILFLNYKMGFLVLFFFAALRGNGNGDYQRYIQLLPMIKNFQQVLVRGDYPFEIGLRFIAFITNSIGLDPQFSLIIMNSISFASVFFFVERHSQIKGLSLLLFYPIVLFFDMHHSRSAVAISLGLLYYDRLLEKQYFQSLVILTIALMFHMSSLALLLLLPVASSSILSEVQIMLKNKPFLKIKLIFLLIILFLAFNPIEIILNVFNNPLTKSIYLKATNYLQNERWSQPFRMYDPRLLLSIGVYLVFDITNNYSSFKNNNLQTIQLLSILAMIFLSFSTIFVIRTYNFYNIFSIVLIPNMISHFKKQYYNIGLTSYIKLDDNEYVGLVRIVYILIILAYLFYTIFMISRQFEYYTFLERVI